MRTFTEIIVFKIMVFYKHTNVKIIRNKYYFIHYTLNHFTKSKSLSNLQGRSEAYFVPLAVFMPPPTITMLATAFPHSCIFWCFIFKAIYVQIPVNIISQIN